MLELNHLFAQAFAHSITHSLAGSFTLTRSLSHSLTHSVHISGSTTESNTLMACMGLSRLEVSWTNFGNTENCCLCRVEKAAEIRKQWTGEMLQNIETQSIKLPAKSPLELAEREPQGGSVGKRLTNEVAIAVGSHTHAEVL